MVNYKHNPLKPLIYLLRGVLVKIVLFKKLKIKGYLMLGRKNWFIIGSKSKISIGKKFHTDDFVEIQSQGSLIIGNSVYINRYSRIVAYERIKIGDNVLIAQNVSILDHDHDFRFENKLIFNGYKTKPIDIGSNVWIGDKVTIMKGINIGDNVIIGANSVVTKNIPSNKIVAGNPCRIIKSLDNE